MEIFDDIPQLFSYYYEGKNDTKQQCVTVTLNVKNPQYRALNCPNEFKRLLTSFLTLKGYKGMVNGVLEYHKPEGTFRQGGLHMHGFVYSRNPPKENKDNLFHFHIAPVDEVRGVRGYIKYSRKALQATQKEFKRLSGLPVVPVQVFGDSPTIRTSLCLFD